MTEPHPFAEEARRRRLDAGSEVIRQHARDDIELEHPPTGIPIGEGLRRIRRRNRLIDWLVTVLIVTMPLALIVLAGLTFSVNGRADQAARRADTAATNGAAARTAAADARDAAQSSEAALQELQRTNDRLNSFVDAFALLATASTPEERTAARAALNRAGAASTTPTTASPPPATTATTTAPATTTTTTTTTTTASPSQTTAPPPTPTTTAAPVLCTIPALDALCPRRTTQRGAP
jgi:hypothetical protein